MDAATLPQALLMALKQRQREEWLAENRAAIAALHS
ncbi:MAG: hypothetical protein AW11_00454 [Candidatus Accumulibacter regalis]|uniref:Uncharacterized protein n=1 Tax=Accumulibacter regalis TaxID=522306 RepID=A0A011QMN9_ACCRE|nr:type II toxin-antitoxin system CcdA family antitoxin [Accumulibacter sp.]EXI90597.1 MAG: hypothetical protein AW11_00454 [Candidatus Accumulibacter regalis]MBL8368054.1 type II toxin-antitoxin system CcdA family antitoxin [Accumulibacter sp.]MBN8513647.1 type II toxin-antitoxin system CcdA family antitoxin [Accumulibacter sp.]HRI92609.1 type II toxin-antitoxin system CcdA family antitoxin [Accumulibacter sp.]